MAMAPLGKWILLSVVQLCAVKSMISLTPIEHPLYARVMLHVPYFYSRIA